MKAVFVLMLAVYLNIVSAAEFTSIKSTRVFADKFTNILLKEQFKSAFDSAKPYWPIPKVEIDGIVNKINQQWPVVQQRFGNSVGMEFIRNEKIGGSFLRYYYLHKFQNHAIYWRIDFYKPQETWKINTVTFLDNLDVLYE